MINRTTIVVEGLILGLCFLGLVPMAQAGNLEPSTVPGPTMETLEQIDQHLYQIPQSWSQTWLCGEFPTGKICPRFVLVLGGAAALDKETGLVWELAPSTDTLDWYEAQIYCRQLKTGNRLGWRLPTVEELLSLVDPAVPSPGPTLPSGAPFSTVQPDSYWSASTAAVNVADAWIVSFGDGGSAFDVKNTDIKFSWCVRGGQSVDPQ